jgi:quercetin dioxygenase-like cupin family protein
MHNRRGPPERTFGRGGRRVSRGLEGRFHLLFFKERTAMIRHLKDIVPETREKAMGGKGSMEVRNLLQGDEFSGKGRLCGRNTLKTGCSVGPHTHKGDFEVYHILQGEGVYNDNGREVIVRPGDTAYAWDGESHALENRSEEDLVFLALILFTGK